MGLALKNLTGDLSYDDMFLCWILGQHAIQGRNFAGNKRLLQLRCTPADQDLRELPTLES